ncbi:MAG TPA: TonB-dependent receptor, partial [Planctomycetaceae bacterium]|nr:TonB-dependent receptor [Planctomycetaceae bacterium]
YQRVAMVQPFVWRQAVPSPEARAAAAEWAQPLLKLFPMPTGTSFAGGVGETVMRGTRPAGLQTGGIRLDQALTRRFSLFGRYNDSPSRNEFGGLAVNRLELRSQALTIGLNARATANTTFDARVNESQATADSDWSVGAECALRPLTESFFSDPTACNHLTRFWIGGVGQFVSGTEGRRRQRQFQTVGSASLRRGGHNFGGGVDYRALEAIRRDPTGTLGVISDDLSGLADRRKLWISRSEGQNASAQVAETSLWIQDTWQAAPRLTIAAGLRWEYSPPPLSSDQTIFLNDSSDGVVSAVRPLWRNSLGNLAPRFGAAWQMTRDGRTVLRAGGGLYYFSSMSIATEILNGGPLSVTTLVSSVRSPASSVLSYGFMPNLRLPYVEQWSLSLERAFGSQSMISGGYVGSSAHRLLRREAGGPGSTVTSMVALTTNHGASNYHGAQVQYRRRMSRGVQLLATFTLARSIDNGSSDSFLMWAAPGPPDRGRSDFDLRLAFTMSASYEPAKLRGWGLDAVFHARSGFPITVLQAEEYQGIALTNAFRPNQAYGQPVWGVSPSDPGGKRLNPIGYTATAPGTQGMLGRNAVGGFGMSQLDLAVRREFRFSEHRTITLRVEAYNVLNHANFADPVRYLNSPVFGQSTSMLNLMLGTGSPGSGLAPILQTGGPRSLQGSARFQF